MIVFRRVLIIFLGILSGIISGGIVLAVPSVGPGIVFGLLVLLPWACLDGLPLWRSIGAILLSPFAYFLAFLFYVKFDFPGFLCGGLGALIACLPLLLRSSRRYLQALLAVLLVGAIAGEIGAKIIQRILDANFTWIIVSALVIWQASIAVVLALALPKQYVRQRGADETGEWKGKDNGDHA